MNFFRDFLTFRQESYTFQKLEVTEVKPNIVCERGVYVTINLKSTNIVYTRRGFDKLYGVVHSNISIPTIKDPENQIQSVTSPSELQDIDPINIQNVVLGNYCLAKSIPYAGGGFSIEIGLFSVRSSELTGPYISLLEKISTVSGVGPSIPTEKIANLMSEGVRLMFGAKDSISLDIGLSNMFDSPENGYFMVFGKESNYFEDNKVKLGAGNRLFNDKDEEITDIPYIVFSIECSKTRSDWYNIKEIREAYDQMYEVFNKGDMDEAELATGHLFHIIAFNRELFPTDALKLRDLIDEEIKARQKIQFQSMNNTNFLPRLEEYQLFESS